MVFLKVRVREGNTEVGHRELRTLKKTLSVLETKREQDLGYIY